MTHGGSHSVSRQKVGSQIADCRIGPIPETGGEMKRFWNLDQGMRDFVRWLAHLGRMPLFLFVTLWGHASILGGAAVFFWVERGLNPRELHFLDAYYWAISIVTTVGNSELNPVTVSGKVTGIILMVFGSLFLWSYTALFAAGFVSTAVKRVGREVQELEESVEEMEERVRLDQATGERLLREIQELRKELKGRK